MILKCNLCTFYYFFFICCSLVVIFFLYLNLKFSFFYFPVFMILKSPYSIKIVFLQAFLILLIHFLNWFAICSFFTSFIYSYYKCISWNVSCTERIVNYLSMIFYCITSCYNSYTLLGCIYRSEYLISFVYSCWLFCKPSFSYYHYIWVVLLF